MTIRVGINGFGRIGRSIFRAINRDTLSMDISIRAINDLTPRKTLIHLLKYDSVMGPLRQNIEESATGMVVGGASISVTDERDPGQIPWGRADVDYVIEATGHFT